MCNSYLYDVALSFAGEDRIYVQKCADILTALGIKVFMMNMNKRSYGEKN
ncbi:MAG: hypothetical protein RR239_02415 [Oscillospiraceae bacterium]